MQILLDSNITPSPCKKCKANTCKKTYFVEKRDKTRLIKEVCDICGNESLSGCGYSCDRLLNGILSEIEYIIDNQKSHKCYNDNAKLLERDFFDIQVYIYLLKYITSKLEEDAFEFRRKKHNLEIKKKLAERGIFINDVD